MCHSRPQSSSCILRTPPPPSTGRTPKNLTVVGTSTNAPVDQGCPLSLDLAHRCDLSFKGRREEHLQRRGSSVRLPAAHSIWCCRAAGPGSFPATTGARGRNLGHPSITGLTHHPHRILIRVFDGDQRPGQGSEQTLREWWGSSVTEPSWLFWTALFFLLSERPMFYFRAHLKDLSVTLIRGGSGCRAVFSVNLKAPAYASNDLLGRKWLFL